MEVVTLLFLLGTAGYVHADCYPGDPAYSAITQSIYDGVTSNSIQLSGPNQLQGIISRHQLCDRLTSHHNTGSVSLHTGPTPTNGQFLIYGYVSLSDCINALTFPQGYNSIAGWRLWDGYQSGKWYTDTNNGEANYGRWKAPFSKQGVYAVQSVEFNSPWRVKNCVTKYQQSTVTCRYGWNQSGTGIPCVWGWDPKDDGCQNGHRGAVVGFTFTVGLSQHCIVWVTEEEAFLDCVKNGRRTRTTSGSGPSEGYGQWVIL